MLNYKFRKMKKVKLITIFCCLFAAGMIALSSCKKNTVTTVDKDTSGASDVSTAENTSNDIISIGAQASENGALTGYRDGSSDYVLSTCAASVIKDTAAKTITVTFNGGTCLDGRTRSGVLVFNYSASTNGARFYRDPGFSMSVTASNYVVDGNQITINHKTVTNITNGGTMVGWNPSTTPEKWSIIADISILKSTGGTVTWQSTRTKTLLNTTTVYTMSDTVKYPANNTFAINWPHAIIQIDGDATGTRPNGETFTAHASAMVRDFNCSPSGNRHPWISGELDYSPSGKYERFINFGSDANGNINNACDLYAKVTIDNVSYII